VTARRLILPIEQALIAAADRAFPWRRTSRFMSRHVAKNFQAISSVANHRRRLHATWRALPRHAEGLESVTLNEDLPVVHDPAKADAGIDRPFADAAHCDF
jgi:hypothetical protein